jgi:hypothetical protein
MINAGAMLAPLRLVNLEGCANRDTINLYIR